MKTKIFEYIDFEKVNTLLEGFNQSTGFVTAILDLEGNVLSKSGWRQICTQFHRIHPVTADRCKTSDTVLASEFKEGEKYHFYKCLNGMVDVAVPIIIKGEHVANLFSGQFFFEKPDVSFFSKQSSRFGFNREVYLKALNDVPVISEDKVKTIMDFLLEMTKLISDMTLQRMDLLELNEALKTSEEQYRLVLENSMDAIVITSAQGTVISANDAACLMFQRSEKEMLELTKNEVIFLDDPRSEKILEERKKNGKAKGELMLYRKDGSLFPADISTSNFSDQNGVIRSSMIIRDITERKKSEEQLIIAKEKAEESDRLKTAFLQNMSHEIRTPMNAIMGFSELLKEKHDDPPKLIQFTNIINQRCSDLLDVINDILDIAKIESGQLQINLEECNINDLFSELSSFFIGYQNRVEKQNIKLQEKIFCHPANLVIYTDKVKLKQIFINLLSNAFKFTEEGVIELGCRLNKNHMLEFYVSDTGLGIPLEKQSIIFERFSQLNLNSKKNTGGTGLGLSIVKGLINLLKGEIYLDSTPGKGSTFSFSISYQVSHEPSKTQKEIVYEKKVIQTNKTVLIVEDDVYNYEYLKEVLSGVGLQTLKAMTGELAVEAVGTQQIDLVLMDIRLPGIDGYEATRQIHKIKPHLKIIAQTAYASYDEKEKALSAGCSDYISKPTKQKSLLQVIDKYLS